MVRIGNPLIQVAAQGAVIDRPQSRATRSTTAAAGIIAVAFLLASAAVSLYLAQISSVATAGYQLEQLEAERNEWIARNGQLELELATRRSLVWSEAAAIQRLGMVRADRPTFVPVDGSAPADCASGSASCPTDAGPVVPSVAATAQRQARPAPGNPIQAFDGIRGWLVSLRRLDE
jgi:hypothetical protein